MLLGFALANSFGTKEGALVGFSLCLMAGLIIGNAEISLFGLSLGLPLG